MSNELQNQDSSVTIAAGTLAVMDTSQLSLVDTKILDNGKGTESLYSRVDADPQYPETVRVGLYPKGAVGELDSTFNVSVRLDTWNKYTDPDSNVHYEPTVVTMAFQTRRQPFFLAGDGMHIKFSNFVSLLYGSTSTGTPDWDGFVKLAAGITDLRFEDQTRT